MQGMTNDERAVLERAAGEPMLDQVTDWAAVNSGSRNLDGLAAMAAIYADAFAALPGELALKESSPVEAMQANGSLKTVRHGCNLPVKVRPEARAEESRVGEECVSTCRSRGSPSREKKKTIK